MMTAQQDHPETLGTASLARAASLTHQFGNLPAIATTDWCERAAGILGGAGVQATPTLVGVVLLDERGMIARIESLGTAPGDLGVEFRKSPSLGWNPRRGGEQIGLISVVSGREDWDRLPLAAAMRPLGAAEPLVGLASLGTSAKGEFILLVAATGAEVESEGAGAYAVVKAAFSFLVSRARVAMGEIGVHAPISVREQEVLEHLIIGKSVRQIAIELGRSPHTVHDHVKNLHRKLNASSRGELIARALGFVPRATRIRDASRPERETPIVDPDRVDGAW